MKRRASVAAIASLACPVEAWVAEIVTGVPVSDVLLALGDAGLDIERVETAGLLPAHAGSR